MIIIYQFLIIDPNRLLKDVFEKVFPEYLFHYSQSIEEALQTICFPNPVSLIFLSDELSTVNTNASFDTLRQQYPYIPIILMGDSPSTAQDALRLGAFAFVDKPIDFDDIQDLIWLYFDTYKPQDNA